MAVNISPRDERCNVGQSDGRTVGRSKAFSPIVGNRSRGFFERDGSSQNIGERRGSRASGHGFLRSAQEDRTVLQEGITPPHLGRADELPSLHEDLSADGGCKAGGRTGCRGDGSTN